MSYVFGGPPGKQDPELAKAAQRRRDAFARDIGDERGRAFSRETPIRRRRWSGILAIVLLLFAGLGAIPLLRGSSGGLVARECERPALGASAGVVSPGGQAAWQVAGPDSGEYVVTLDSDAPTADGDGRVAVTGGRVLAGPFRLSDCLSAQTVFDAPTDRGTHEVTLYRRTAAAYQPVASDVIKVG